MRSTEYEFLRRRTERGVAFVTISHPPMNLLDLALVKELGRFLSFPVGYYTLHPNVGLNST
jgi:hypothetical protein